MEGFWILFFVSLFATNLLDKAESVKVKLELKTFDEIFGEGWWDKGEAAEDLKTPAPTEAEQNEMMEEITSNENVAEDERKRKIVDKFLAIKDEFKQKGKYSKKEWNKIDNKIAKHLKVNRNKIYEWKKEFGLSRKMHNLGKEKNERKNLVEKFDQMKAELKRAGFKNSFHHEIDKTVAKELGLSLTTIYNWKSDLGQTIQHKHSDSEKKKLMKSYYEIKDKNPKICVGEIAKMLKISNVTLYKWIKQFNRQLDSVEETAANVQEIENTSSGSI